jgi:hypothetical protein
LPNATIHDGGVYDAEGNVVMSAIHRGTMKVHLPSPNLPREEPERLAGRWLWGGVLHWHFGHFLTESLGRLWHLPEVKGDLDGVLWMVRHERAVLDADRFVHLADKGFITGVFEHLGISTSHRVVINPLQVERLVVPAQLMMNTNGPLIGGHAVFRNFVQRAAERVRSAEGKSGGALYVSRANQAGLGRFVLEEEIEAAFSAAGWSVLRPETLDVASQIAAYRAADRLVFAEGSAIHLYAMVARPEQQVAIITRRLPRKLKFEHQLRAFGVKAVQTIDVVTGVVVQMKVGSQAKPSAGELNKAEALLDEVALEKALVEAGLFSPGEWRPPAAGRLAAAVDALCGHRPEGKRGREYRVFSRDGLRLANSASPHPGAADAAA